MRLPRRLRPLLAGAIALAAVWTPMTAAGGQEAPAALKVTREAFYTSRFLGSLPPVLTKQVPPSPVCLVAPAQVCGPEVDALKATLGLNKGLPIPDVPDFQLPQPVAPGTLAVGMIGGQTRYTSALRFDLPTVPENALVEKFDLVLDEGDLTFAIESPAFRGAILAGLSQYPEQHPEALQAYLEGVAGGNPAVADFEPTGIEACIIRSAWTAGASQDSTTRPAADCLLGGTGQRDTAAGTWTFDISSIVQAWVDGDAPNEGIYLGPLGAQNVAYGDPDPTTNFEISLNTTSGTGPRAVAEFGEKPPDVSDSGSDVSGGLGGDLGVGGPVASVDAFSNVLPSAGACGRHPPQHAPAAIDAVVDLARHPVRDRRLLRAHPGARRHTRAGHPAARRDVASGAYAPELKDRGREVARQNRCSSVRAAACP
jgi:hypothetical protein